MFGVWRYENHVSSGCTAFVSLTCDLTSAFQNVDFVFPIVTVQRRMTFWLEFEQAHGKVWGAVVFFN